MCPSMGILEPFVDALDHLPVLEAQASGLLGVSVPQLRFALALLAAVPVGAGARLISGVQGARCPAVMG